MNYEQLETNGWYIKVGDVYSSPFDPFHFRVTSIELENGDDPDDAMLYGKSVYPKDHSIDVHNAREEINFRAWLLNEEYSLEHKG